MIKIFKDSFIEIFLFLKKPVDNVSSNQTFKEKITKLTLVFIIDIIVAGISILLLTILQNYGLFSLENHKVIELLKLMPKSAVIFLFIIILPLIEELIFRLYLRYKTNYLLRFCIFLLYILGKDNKEHLEERIKKMWYEKYGYIFYFSAVLFGFVHIFNFDVDKKMLLLFPILTAPQIFVGIFTGYLRVRYNLIWGFFLHAIHNMILLLPFLFLGNTTDLINTDTNDYTIKIEEVFNSEANQEAKFFRDSIYFKNYNLIDIIAYTSNKDSWLIETTNEKKIDKKINLSYKNKLDSNFIDRKIIEKHLTDIYKLKINKELKLVNAWGLIIEDSIKLIQHRTDSVKGNYISFSKDSAIIHRVQFAGIASAIQNSKMKIVFLKDNIAGRFNIRLNTKDTTELKSQLDSIYGLKLVDSLATIEYLKID